MATSTKIVLFVVLPIILLIAIVAIAVATGFSRSSTVISKSQVAAGESLSLDMTNAEVTFTPSNDNEVRVTMRGNYIGPTPEIKLETVGTETEITGGCPEFWFSICFIELSVELPADIPVDAVTVNGALTTEGLSGALSLISTNGAISVTDSEGRLGLRTTNGAVVVTNSESELVDAASTNGRIGLEFAAPPSTVVASTTNGSIVVTVPDDDEEYFVNAQTTNGSTNTGSISTDQDAERSITARTTNGSITVEAAD